LGDLPGKLTTSGTPAGADPDVGDLALLRALDNRAIYHRDSGYSELTEQAELKRVIVDDGQRQNARPFRSVVMRRSPKFLVVEQGR
jgi:hypothetical protein